ncbi:fibronectin type III domain-containing protein [Weeksellaceae bacterium KMM 9724]|uniref:fibronectin type III domain-containing protein n=1 Tax=Profundicola chukchiensis TaxID=2961959 RepID=UPI00243CE497|nr:fibronectin type III domain-containing protein [Profundicola chukchiensis]MDG4949375.1 fibronectin type III domain-containing protein [Profundicola chukchiensis]
MKKFTFFLCAIFLSLIGYAQNSETFTNLDNASGGGNGISSSYQTWTWIGDNGATWEATDARKDQNIDGKAITVRDGSLTTTISGGIGNLTLTTQRKFTGGSGNLTVLANGEVVGTFAYGDSEQTNTIAGINLSGNVALEIQTPGNGDRVAMDNLNWTNPIDSPDYDCPSSQANIGDSCDDGNPLTNNDTINEDCECVGTPVDVGNLCGFENFDNADLSGSYEDGSFVGNDNITWTYIEARSESANSDTDVNALLDGNAIILRNSDTGSKIYSSTISGGISRFSVKLYKAFTGGGDRQVELFINGVSYGNSTVFDDYNEHIFTVDDIDLAGDFTLEIRNTTSKQIIIDDISWTCFEDEGGPADCEAPDTLEVNNITENSVDLIWSGGSIEYHWLVAYGESPYTPSEEDGELVYGFIDYDSTNFMTHSLGELNPGTQYDVYVKTMCEESWDNLSDWIQTSFTTEAPAQCLAPQSAEASDITPHTANISWTGGSAAEAWIIAYGVAPYTPMESDEELVIGNAQYLLERLEADTEYEFYIRTACDEDLENLSDWLFITFTTEAAEPCLAPETIDVTEITETSAQVSWSAGSQEYWFVSYGESPFEPSGDVTMVSGNPSISLDNLEPGTSYDVHIQSICNDFDTASEWTTVTFTTTSTEPEPEECDIPYGVALNRISPTSATFVAGNSVWHYQGSANRAGRPLRPYPMYGMNDMTVPHTQHRLVPAFDYDVWIRTICEDGTFSPWAGPFYLPTYEDASRRTPDMILSPNPAVAMVSISKVDARTIEVFDMNGSHIKTFNTKDSQFDVTGLPTGKYNLRIIDADGSIHYDQMIKK